MYGLENRLEMVMEQEAGTLLQLPSNLWYNFVEQAGVRVISQITDAQASAYLLSHSSLFIFRDRIILLTCGATDFKNLLRFFGDQFGLESIAELKYEVRRTDLTLNPNSSFTVSESFFKEKLSALSFKERITTENYSSCSIGGVSPENSKKRSSRLILFDIPDFLRKGTLAYVRDLLSDFKIDEHMFTPPGYSLNAIRREEYFTMHINVDGARTSASVETDAFARDELEKLAESFRARSYYIY